MHSVVTNNTVSTVLGLGDTVIKEKTGKYLGDHLLNKVFRNNDFKSNNNKDIKWAFEKFN